MNKSLLALLLGVCVVGMGLLMYQEKRESSRPEKPIQADAAASRPADQLSPAPQTPRAVPIPPQVGRPATPAQAGRTVETPPRANAPLAVGNPAVPRPEKESGGGKAGEPKPREEKNSGGEKIPTTEKAPVTEKTPVVEKIPALPEETRPVPAAEPPAEQAARAPAIPVLPDMPAASSGQPAKAAETPLRPGAGRNAKLVVFARDTGATVRLTSGSPVRYQTLTLTGPDRVVVDVEGLSGLKAPGVPKNPMVSNVRLGANGGKTRIVIDLTAKPRNTRFVLSKEKDTLDIRIDQ
ncbi:MAG: AMIN domain-containing protein [Desulfovibrio sp.]|jgi:hypothetical protein|nr:AMIN domain-containing protein [Desulfovibrio sp.]